MVSARILKGKEIAIRIRTALAREIAELAEQKLQPGLAVVLVGTDPASTSYVTAKEKACAELGIYSDDNRLPATTTEEELLVLIQELNQNPRIHGILVQLPLPAHIREDVVLQAISPDKDADGFHPINLGKMMLGLPAFLPCTPHGVIQILSDSGVSTVGAHVVIVGRSNIVGKPLAAMLMQKSDKANATVTVCHTRTNDVGYHTRQADILIAAAGSPGMITGEMIKPGAVVIDVGVNRVDDSSRERGYRLVGDVVFEEAREVASMITPVPGGVGPLTITMLLANTIQSARNTLNRNGR
jgi:methylenetetrahydrofolate dehydrogenase (NADP+) / methenyltetrahydrofolate cyclohydrolase